jgi:mevalonate kinase
MELLINPPSKHMGKTMIKKAINEYWYTKYNEEKSTKTTIRHLEIQKEPVSQLLSLAWQFQKISLYNIYPVLLLLVLLPSMHRQL